MKELSLVLLSALMLTACSQTYYVVRHAEKEIQAANMSADVPLSSLGKQRAEALKNKLANKHIVYIFSTNTTRTRATAEPLATAKHIDIQTYGAIPTQGFIDSLKQLHKNVLIVGHSNTVDDIVNGLTGTKFIAADLRDSEYSNLFVIKRKGNKFRFIQKTYGEKEK